MNIRPKRSAQRALLALAFLALAAIPALARTLTIQKFHTEVTITPDGIVDVVETFQAHFAGSWNGLYRTIPVEYATAQGLNYSLFVDVLGVTDESGNSLRYDTSHSEGYLKLKIYETNATDVTRTIIVHYRTSDALKFFEDHDELYWNVTGNDWDMPIQNASASIVLPQGVTGLRALAFTGTYGSKSQDAKIEINASRVDIEMTRTLEFHEGLTAVIGWDKGFVHEPTASEKFVQFLRSNWPLVIPIVAFLLMFWIWWTHGRDPRRNPIAVRYDPPDDLTPGEVGTLVDGSAAMRDITATLVDMGVRGYITIEQIENKHMMGLYADKTYTFHLKKPYSDWKGLKSHELSLLAALFTNGAVDAVSLAQLQNHFYKDLPAIKDGLLDSMLEHGYYLHRPDNVRGGWMAGGIIVGVMLALFGNWIAASLGMAPLPFIISGIATGLVMLVFGYFMPARTDKGERALEGVLGFEDFLQHVESDRIERIEKTPEMFEKFLPFAMALGVEKKWVGAFGDICKQPPSWYQGGVYGPNFYPMMFIAQMHMMSVQASAAMISAPRSVSGGSGFGGMGGGGGFSGGGFGGGGGGGF
ncbi:MAG: DUF2207 domain-containing protein [Candidatus Acidiferrales bacterium]